MVFAVSKNTTTHFSGPTITRHKQLVDKKLTRAQAQSSKSETEDTNFLADQGGEYEKKKMQQRKSTFGRPSGTDGSDYSYRMVVDSRYQLVAKGKKRLSMLFVIEALFLLIGVIFALLPGIEEHTPNTVAFSSAIVSVVSLIIADIGRRRSKSSLLRFYAILSSTATLLLIASLAKQFSLLKAIRDFSFWGTRKFDANDFPGLQTGLLVYILPLSLFKICTIKAVVSLLFNMSPPKKAS